MGASCHPCLRINEDTIQYNTIIGRSRREKVRSEQTREELGAHETVVQKIKKRRLQWFGHVEWMEGKRLPNAALHGHVEGKISRGRQRKT